MRPTPATMSDSHLLDEYLVVYRDCGRRRAAIRAELESRLAAWPEIANLRIERDAARAEMMRLQGIIDDVESESGHCHFLDDAEHEPPHLPDHVRAIVQERDAARAELEQLHLAIRFGECSAARADLRDMLARLCAAVEHCAPGYGVYEDWCDITDYDILTLQERMIEAKALLVKHKETNQ